MTMNSVNLSVKGLAKNVLFGQDNLDPVGNDEIYLVRTSSKNGRVVSYSVSSLQRNGQVLSSLKVEGLTQNNTRYASGVELKAFEAQA